MIGPLSMGKFYFVGYLEAYCSKLHGDISKDGIHLGCCLHPFLLGVSAYAWGRQIFAGTKRRSGGREPQRRQLIDEMDVVGGD